MARETGPGRRKARAVRSWTRGKDRGKRRLCLRTVYYKAKKNGRSEAAQRGFYSRGWGKKDSYTRCGKPIAGSNR